MYLQMQSNQALVHVLVKFISSPLNSPFREGQHFTFMEPVCRTATVPLKNFKQHISDISSRLIGHTSTEQMTQTKGIKTKLRLNLISPVKVLCSAGIQEVQHLNRASERVEKESG